MIRKRRLDLGIRQKDAARIIGCDQMTMVNWEKGHTAFPRIQHMAGVVRFLGFNPVPDGGTVAERLVNRRTALGITQKEFARQIGVDPSTLARWERGERIPADKFERCVATAFERLETQNRDFLGVTGKLLQTSL
ncbi:MAG: helix-turn-helix transcriptional regulator [Chthoniobacter sp.]|nr:helix-turn-helix transcriptional regulator [Chthoniobacter sp.]